MANEFNGRDVTVNITLALNNEGLKTPFNIAQSELSALFQAAGSNPGALATKVGTSIAYLSIGSAKLISWQGYNAVQVGIQINSGDTDAVLAEIMGIVGGGLTGLGFRTLLSVVPNPTAKALSTPGGAVVGAVTGELIKNGVKDTLDAAGSSASIDVGVGTIHIDKTVGFSQSPDSYPPPCLLRIRRPTRSCCSIPSPNK